MFCQIAALLQGESSLKEHSHNFDQNNITHAHIIIIPVIILPGVIEIKLVHFCAFLIVGS